MEIQIEKIENTLEAVLFASGNPIAIGDLVDKLGLQKSEIKKAIKFLTEKYSGNCGIHLLEYAGKYHFGTNPSYREPIAKLLSEIHERNLSNAGNETMTIVAYKQPVTRLEIAEIRGVNSDSAVQQLLDQNLIEMVGRKDAVGKPALFGTTENFLKRFKLRSLEDLPSYEEMLDKIALLKERRGTAPEVQETSMYNEFKIPTEEVIEEKQEAAVTLVEEEIPDFLKGEDGLEVIK